MHSFHKRATALSCVALLLALSACGKPDDTTALTTGSDTTKSSPSMPSTTANTAPPMSDVTTGSTAPGSSDTRSNASVMGAAGDMMDDAGIVARIKTGLAVDSDLRALQIDVDARDGIVTLSGTAPSAAARDRATDIARNTKDVRDVKNNLKVTSG